MLLHADAVAENRSACVRTGGINRDDADRAFFLTVVVGQLIDQRALTRPRRTGESKYPRLSAVGKKCLEQFGPARRTVFDRADGPGKGARIAGAKLVNPLLDFCFQDVQCKAGGDNWEPGPQDTLRQRLRRFDHLLRARPHAIVFRQVDPADHA